MSEKAYYLIELFEDGVKGAWEKLMADALEKADFVEFAAPTIQVLEGFKWRKWQWQPPTSLVSSLVQKYESRWKYQADQKSETIFYRFRLTPEMVAFVQSEPLVAWHGGNELPEDPAFYRDDSPILWTISHEQFAYVWLTAAEAQVWQDTEFIMGMRSFYRIENRRSPTKRPLTP